MFMAPCVLLLVILPLMSTKLINNEYLQKFIVRFHNKIRGQERAADMMKLSWSFQLAKEADQWAHKCVFEHAMIARGQNLGLIGDPGSIKYNIQHIMQLWVDEKKKYDPRKKGCNNSCHYTQLVWAKTTHVGCSIHFCNNFGTSKRFTNYMFFVCFYSPRGNIGRHVYTPGKQCSKCPENFHRCSHGLCRGYCYDHYKRCHRLAEKGKCLTDIRFMEFSCTKSCHLC